jgi:hypothetical protein
VNFLDPLKVDAGHDAYQQVNVLGNVGIITNDAAVQTFVEHQVGVGWNVFPGRELAGLQACISLGFFVAVQVEASLAGA